jgi:hypothetical protein
MKKPMPVPVLYVRTKYAPWLTKFQNVPAGACEARDVKPVRTAHAPWLINRIFCMFQLEHVKQEM